MQYEGRERGARGEVLLIRCACGLLIRHPAGQFRVHCACGATEAVDQVRSRVVDEQREEGQKDTDMDEWP